MRRFAAVLLGILLGAPLAAQLPGSGTISIGDIAAEFGGTAPHALSEYYRTPHNVPVPDTSFNALVPTSGTISLSNFHGARSTIPDAVMTLTIGSGTIGYTEVPNPNPPHDPPFFTVPITGYGRNGSGDSHWGPGTDAFGVLTPSSYTDASGTERHINALTFSAPPVVVLSLAGTGIPDTDATFKSIIINGNEFTRSSRSQYNSAVNNSTSWMWAAVSAPFGTSGQVSVTIVLN